MTSPDDEPTSPLPEEAPPSPDSDTPSRPDGRDEATPGGEHSDPGASEPQEHRGQIRGEARRGDSDKISSNGWWDRFTDKFSQFWDRGGRELIGGTVVLGVAVATVMSGGTALGAFAAFEAGMAAAGGFSMATLGATELAVNDPSMDQQFDEASEALTNYVDPLQQGTATVGAVATGTEEGAEQGARVGEAINTVRGIWSIFRAGQDMLRVDGDDFVPPPRQVPGAQPLGRLTQTGPSTWESTAGLIYGPDPQFGNRVNHVLQHLRPNPSKRYHTVFSVPRSELLQLIDEAWLRRGLPEPDDPAAFVVPMGRVIGSNGERSIRIVVYRGTSRIRTAYPVR